MDGSGSLSRRALLLGAAAFGTGLAACARGGRTAAPSVATTTVTVAVPAGAERPSPNAYLSGNFAPVVKEVDAANLPVQGAIPRELRGHLLRVGPNPIAPDPADYHWFLGDGMVHGIELRDGRALAYRNRWVRTDQAAPRLGGAPRPGQPPDVSPVSSAANTSVVAHAGRVLTLYEISLPTEVTPTLETRGRYDFGGRLRSPMTAHPKIDAQTGELLFFGLDILGPPYLRFHVVDASGTLVRSTDIIVPGASMMHDFAITENHVVFLDLPVVYDLALVGKRPFPAKWQPDYGARVGVMPRRGDGAVRWFDVEPCYVFHTLNAYDDGDRVVIDLVRHATMFERDIYGVGDAPGTLERWTVDLDRGRVSEERVDDRGQELPRIDDRLVGRRHRYGYNNLVPSQRDGRVEIGGLIQHDLRTGRSVPARLGPGKAASEGVFVPARDGADEDEGWVLSVVYDPARDGSDLVILDATDFGGRPVAVVGLPQRVPFGFHGTWVAAASIPRASRRAGS